MPLGLIHDKSLLPLLPYLRPRQNGRHFADGMLKYISLIEIDTWSETYFRQDLFPSYLFSRRQFHAIVIFRLKSISDLDSGSLPIFFLVNSYT